MNPCQCGPEMLLAVALSRRQLHCALEVWSLCVYIEGGDGCHLVNNWGVGRAVSLAFSASRIPRAPPKPAKERRVLAAGISRRLSLITAPLQSLFKLDLRQMVDRIR